MPCFVREIPFWANLVVKIKIVGLRLNLASRLTPICWSWWWCSFVMLRTKNTLFSRNLVQENKIVCLRWNLVIRLIRICWIRWWCSNFLFRTGSTFIGQIWFKKAKLSDCGKTWCLDYFKYGELDGNVHLFCYVQETHFWANLVEKINILRWCVKFAKKVDIKWQTFKKCQIFCFVLFCIINYKKKWKQFIRLITNIYQQKVLII